jgi:hypothetical protein
MVASKNPEGNGSVYFEAAFGRSDGLVVKARWREGKVDERMGAAPGHRTGPERRERASVEKVRQPVGLTRRVATAGIVGS